MHNKIGILNWDLNNYSPKCLTSLLRSAWLSLAMLYSHALYMGWDRLPIATQSHPLTSALLITHLFSNSSRKQLLELLKRVVVRSKTVHSMLPRSFFCLLGTCQVNVSILATWALFSVADLLCELLRKVSLQKRKRCNSLFSIILGSNPKWDGCRHKYQSDCCPFTKINRLRKV